MCIRDSCQSDYQSDSFVAGTGQVDKCRDDGHGRTDVYKRQDEFLAKGTKLSSADEALGIKAVDYIALAPVSYTHLVYTVQLFINDEVQRFRHFVHTLVVLLLVDFFRLQHTGFNALFTQELNQCFVLRQTFVAAAPTSATRSP